MATKWLCVPFLQKNCTYAGGVGGGGGLDFQKIIYVNLKKKNNDKNLKKKLENCSRVLSFNRFIILLKPSSLPLLD